MDSFPLTLIFDDEATALSKNNSNSLIFAQQIAELVSTYFRTAHSSRVEIIKLLGKTYENNYLGFVR